MYNLTTYADQSVFDLALQVYGSVEGVFDLLRANPGLELDSHIAPGTILQVPESAATQQAIVDYYQKNTIKPATGNIENLPEYIVRTSIIHSYYFDVFMGVGFTLFLEGIQGNLEVIINYKDVSFADSVHVDITRCDNAAPDSISEPEESLTIPIGSGSVSAFLLNVRTSYISFLFTYTNDQSDPTGEITTIEIKKL